MDQSVSLWGMGGISFQNINTKVAIFVLSLVTRLTEVFQSAKVAKNMKCYKSDHLR